MSGAPCATRPQALTVCPQVIPQELRDLPCWLVWGYVENADPETGEVGWDKPPVCARTRRLGSSTDRRTWSKFAVALGAYQAGGLDGLGLALDPQRDAAGLVLVAIDLDHCRDPGTNEIESWAGGVIESIGSYTEVSPSGTGIRIFLRGRPLARGRKKGPVEVYCRGRYVTVTGQHVAGTPAGVEARPEALVTFLAQHFPEPKPQEKAPPGGGMPTDLDDAEVIRRARRAKNGDKFRRLWDGDFDGYASRSEADLALCGQLRFWCGRDPERIDVLFRQSGLFRAKWDRAGYRQDTIAKALSGAVYGENGCHLGNGLAGQRHKPASAAKAPTPGGEQHLTDLGNARRVVQRHGADLRFVHPWKAFLVWDGKRWAEDQTAEAVRRVKETLGWLYGQTLARLNELAHADPKDEKAQEEKQWLTKFLRHLLRWEDARDIARSLELVKSEPGMPVLPNQLDRDPLLLNVLNGTLDLRTGQLRPHRREDLLTKLAPVGHRPDAPCPLWEKFLLRIMDGNQDLIGYLQRLVGYAMTGDVSEQCLWFFYGTGANGKSTFLGTILALLGDYGMQAVSDLLMVKKHESHPTERADLFGRRFVATIETEEGKRMAEALMKQLTGGDKVRARKMFKDFFEFAATHKIVLAANHKPVIRGADHANWRRIKLVPFTVTIPDDEKDKHLPDKLKAELPGILNWCLAGCRDWLANGLGEPDEVRQATAEYRCEQDAVQGFLDECCVVHAEARIRASALLEAYCRWSGDQLMSRQAFGQRLRQKGFTSQRGHGGGYFWHGVGLLGQGAGEHG